MNKLLLSLAALAVSAAASAQNVYSTDFEGADEFAKWTVVDANNDGVTWVYDAEGSQSKVFYAYSSSNVADDWLISPAITPTATGKLMVQYTTYGTSYGEKLAVYTGNAPMVEAMTKLQAQNDKVLGVRTTEYFFYDATAGVPFHVGFHTTSPADQWRFYMCEFSVKQVDKVVDLQVDNVLSPVSGDPTTILLLSWCATAEPLRRLTRGALSRATTQPTSSSTTSTATTASGRSIRLRI